MTATTLPTSRPVTQDWNQDFEWLNGIHYPNGFYDSIGWVGHNGIDYGCWEGDPAEAVCDGVIEFAGAGNNHWLLTGGGNAILLRNEELGVMFEYLHLSAFNVTQGQTVKRGQVIARTGNTGTSTAPHLHLGAIPIYNVNVNNGYRGRVDPTPFLYGPLNPDYAGGAAIGPQSTTITPKEWDDMATEKQLYDVMAKALWEVLEGGRATKRLQTIVMGATAPSIDGKPWTLSSHLKGTAVRTVQIVKDVAALRGELAGVKNQVAQLANASGTQLDASAVAAASAEGTRAALAEAQAIDAKLIADAVVDEQAARLAGDAA